MNVKLLAIALGFGLISMQTQAEQQGQNPTVSATKTTTMNQGALNAAEQNRLAGDSFIEHNKAKPGVVTLQTGLQYKVLKAGHGPKPGANDVVSVDYEGKLIDGTVFDSSKQHGGPASFKVGEVIPGWVEALQLMPAGSTWELYIPGALAYGEQGAPPQIGPNQTLIFTVTLHSIKKG